jgi:hypothetical protein
LKELETKLFRIQSPSLTITYAKPDLQISRLQPSSSNLNIKANKYEKFKINVPTPFSSDTITLDPRNVWEDKRKLPKITSSPSIPWILHAQLKTKAGELIERCKKCADKEIKCEGCSWVEKSLGIKDNEPKVKIAYAFANSAAGCHSGDIENRSK